MTSVPTRGRRHTAAMMSRARRLREGGWTYREIGRLLEEEFGCEVHFSTVRRWVDSRAAEMQLGFQREFIRRRAAQSVGRLAGHESATDAFRLVRLRALSELGLSASAIAAVMTFDFAVVLTVDQVRHALKTGHYPKRAARAAA